MPPKTKIFVGKLPQGIKDMELKKLFDTFGEVTECSVMGSYAFVHMKTEDESANAIQNLNNYELHGSRISVEPSTGEKKAGRGGGRGGGGGGGRGGGFRGGRGGGGMRGGRGGPPRMGPYDRRPPMEDRYGGGMRNGYYDYERRERRPMERRPMYGGGGGGGGGGSASGGGGGYDHYDSYDRMERRPPPPAYDRREDPYMYPREPQMNSYGAKDMYGGYPQGPRGQDQYYSSPRDIPPRRY